MENEKRNLIGLDLKELADEVAALGFEKYRAKQIWSWLYFRGARDFSAMTTFAKPARELLAAHFCIERPAISAHQKSIDGTQKWLVRMADGKEVECVHIPEEDRGALCVSSQVGCMLACKFCHTGTQKFTRNLEPAEILGQIMLARDALYQTTSERIDIARLHSLCASPAPCRAEPLISGAPSVPRGAGSSQPLVTPTSPLIKRLASHEWAKADRKPSEGKKPASNDERTMTNIVMMGMGEPLFNYDNVAKALRIVMDGDGIGIGKRRITLSTAGVVPLIPKCGEELGVNLAVSLHAVTDELRDVLVPVNRKYPIKELLKACRAYPCSKNSRRITFEYVMLKGVNDSLADAKELVRLLRGIPAKINLIPFNAWPGAPFECSSEDAIQMFGDYVNEKGYASPVRTPRGRDIMAACGQLKSATIHSS